MMEHTKAEHVRDSVIAIRPVYTEEGDISEIITRSGEVLADRRQIRSVMKGLLRSYGLDIIYQRRFIRERLRRKSVMPCYLSEERVFIPVKMRKAAVSGDNVYGYLDVGVLKEISPKGDGQSGCLLVLSNGICLEALSGRATVLKAQDSGNELRKILIAEKNRPAESRYYQRLAEWGLRLGQTLGGLMEQIDRIERSLNNGREQAE